MTYPRRQYLAVLAVFVACFKVTAAGEVLKGCVCSKHPSTTVYPRPVASGEPIGYMYRDECFVENQTPMFQHAQFAAVEHFGKIGFVRDDILLSHNLCKFYETNNSITFMEIVGFQITTQPQPLTTRLQSPTASPHVTISHQSTSSHHASVSTKSASTRHTIQSHPITTAHATTISRSIPTHSTVPPNNVTTRKYSAMSLLTNPRPSATPNNTSLAPGAVQYTKPQPTQTNLPVCNKVALFTEIARSINVGTSRSLLCPDGIHHESDAAIIALCGAPTPALWLRGMKVIDNCQILPKYTPIAQFDNTQTYKQSAGVFLGCERNSLFMATQDCSTTIHILKVDSMPDLNQLYVVEW